MAAEVLEASVVVSMATEAVVEEEAGPLAATPVVVPELYNAAATDKGATAMAEVAVAEITVA
jgi:hypothetical protein